MVYSNVKEVVLRRARLCFILGLSCKYAGKSGSKVLMYKGEGAVQYTYQPHPAEPDPFTHYAHVDCWEQFLELTPCSECKGYGENPKLPRGWKFRNWCETCMDHHGLAPQQSTP